MIKPETIFNCNIELKKVYEALREKLQKGEYGIVEDRLRITVVATINLLELYAENQKEKNETT